MALFIDRTLKNVLREQFGALSVQTIQGSIEDFSSIGFMYRDSVIDVYGKGIITGYPDGTFGGERTATRAEAATMLVRMLEPSQRIPWKLDEGDTFTLASGLVVPQKVATLSELNIVKIDVYEGNIIRVFSKVEQGMALYVGQESARSTVQANQNWWDIDGYHVYIFTISSDPSNKELRLLIGHEAFLLKGVDL